MSIRSWISFRYLTQSSGVKPPSVSSLPEGVQEHYGESCPVLEGAAKLIPPGVELRGEHL